MSAPYGLRKNKFGRCLILGSLLPNRRSQAVFRRATQF